MAGQCLYFLFIFWFCLLWRKFVVFLSRSPVWVFVCHARHCDVVTLREFSGFSWVSLSAFFQVTRVLVSYFQSSFA